MAFVQLQHTYCGHVNRHIHVKQKQTKKVLVVLCVLRSLFFNVSMSFLLILACDSFDFCSILDGGMHIVGLACIYITLEIQVSWWNA